MMFSMWWKFYKCRHKWAQRRTDGQTDRKCHSSTNRALSSVIWQKPMRPLQRYLLA